MNKKVILILLSTSNFHLGFSMESKKSEELKEFQNFEQLPKDMQLEVLKSAIENSKSLKDIQNLEKISKSVRLMLYSESLKELIAKKRIQILQSIQEKLTNAAININIIKDINNKDEWQYCIGLCC